MTAAARMRRSRERRRRGAFCVTLEIGWNDLDALGALGLLDTDEADPVKIRWYGFHGFGCHLGNVGLTA